MGRFEPLTIAIEPARRQMLEKLARDRDRSVSSLVRVLVQKGLDTENRERDGERKAC